MSPPGPRTEPCTIILKMDREAHPKVVRTWMADKIRKAAAKRTPRTPAPRKPGPRSKI